MNILEQYQKISRSNYIKKDLSDVHPKQFVNCLGDIPIICYKIKYKYTTNRGNVKKGEKYFLFNSLNPQIDVKNELNKYIENYNNDNPNRKLLNVKFLDSQCLGYMTL